MSDSEPPANSDDRERREIRARLATLFRKTGEHRYWAAAYILRNSDDLLTASDILGAPDIPTKNLPNRPGIEDQEALFKMAGLMVMEGFSRWKAACLVAEMNPGHSLDSTARRLHRKYKKTKHGYEVTWEGIRRSEVMWEGIRRSRRNWEAMAASANTLRSMIQVKKYIPVVGGIIAAAIQRIQRKKVRVADRKT